MNESVSEIFQQLITVIALYGLRVAGALLLLIAGWIVAGWAAKAADARLRKVQGVDATVRPMAGKLVRGTVLFLTLIIVLQQFGVQAASLLTVLGTMGLAIGLALQGSLSNVASGVMLLFLRPFRVGDVVEVHNLTGKVEEIGLFSTFLNTPDNVRVIMPNSKIWGTEIKNFSYNSRRRIDLVVSIGYQVSIPRAMDVLHEILGKDERVLKDPEPMVAVGDLAESAVELLVRPWVETPNFFQAKVDLTRKIKERFDREGIEIPFPMREIHVVKKNLPGDDPANGV